MEKKPPRIYKVKDPAPNEKFKDLHPHLPAPPSLLLIIGSIKQGKSNLVVNLCLSPEMYKDKFDEVHIISNTLNADPKGKILKKYFACEDHYKDSMIDNIIDKQKSYDESTRPSVAIFLDDILNKDFTKSNKVSFLATKFRHFGIDMLCFTTQSFRSVSSLVRSNCSDVILMKQQSSGKRGELEKIIEEYGEFYGDDKLRDAYNEVMKKKYDFLYLKLSENPAQLFRNFEERLI